MRDDTRIGTSGLAMVADGGGCCGWRALRLVVAVPRIPPQQFAVWSIGIESRSFTQMEVGVASDCLPVMG